jgi:hypothetical protein
MTPLQTALVTGCLWVATHSALVAGVEQELSPRMKFAALEHDFGRIKSGDVVNFDFAFTNTGTASLEIASVKPSCGCTLAGKSQQTIAAGQAGVIPVRFNSRNFSGRVSKTIRVSSNDSLHPEQILRIHADIWAPVQLEPKTTIFYYESGASTGETKVVRILNNQEEPIELLSPEPTHPAFQLHLKTLQPGREFELAVRLLPSTGTGTVSMPISLRTPGSDAPLLKTRVYAFEREAIRVSPKVIRLSAGQRESSRTVPVTIRNQSQMKLELTDPQSSIPGVKLALKELQPGQLFHLVAEFPAGVSLQEPSRMEVSVASNHPRHTRIRIPISLTKGAPQDIRAVTSQKSSQAAEQTRRLPVNLPSLRDTTSDESIAGTGSTRS